MSLPVLKALCCDISQQHLSLFQGNVALNATDRNPDVSLSEQLIPLIQPYVGWFPWRQSIEFTLGPDLTHHLVTHWQDGINTPGELRNYSTLLAQKCFPQLAEKPFQTGFIDYCYQGNALAMIVEQEIWQVLQTTAKHLKLRLRNIGTPLQSLLGTWHTTLPDVGIFAAIGETSSAFAFRLEGEWQQIYQLALPGISAQKQLALVSRLAGTQNITCHYWDKFSGRITLAANVT